MLKKSIILALFFATHLSAFAKTETITSQERAEYIRSAIVWEPTDIASKDLLAGPQRHRPFRFLEEITCDYLDGAPKQGNTPKFHCLYNGKDKLKIKYLKSNGEVYGEIAGSRLMWALGFATDDDYAVRATVNHCPKNPWENSGDRATRLIEPATVQRKFPGVIMQDQDQSGWGFEELAQVDPSRGGATKEQLDALKLLAAFIQHRDNGHRNQHLVCAKEGVTYDASGHLICRKPVLSQHDLGSTFGGSSSFISLSKVESGPWARTSVWADSERCIANVGSFIIDGTLHNPQISEQGRRFLAGLLVQLSDRQIRDLFTAARVELREPGTPVEQWVNIFKSKVKEVVDARCPR